MSTLTVYLARLIGLSTVLLAAGILVRGSALIIATVADGPVLLVYASFSLTAGLAIILGHNVWSWRYLTGHSHLFRMVDLRERVGALAGNP